MQMKVMRVGAWVFGRRGRARPLHPVKGRRVEHLSWERRRTLSPDYSQHEALAGILMTWPTVNFSSRVVRRDPGFVGSILANHLPETIEIRIEAANHCRTMDALVFACRTDRTTLAAELSPGHQIRLSSEDRMTADTPLGLVRHGSPRERIGKCCHCRREPPEMEAVA